MPLMNRISRTFSYSFGIPPSTMNIPTPWSIPKTRHWHTPHVPSINSSRTRPSTMTYTTSSKWQSSPTISATCVKCSNGIFSTVTSPPAAFRNPPSMKLDYQMDLCQGNRQVAQSAAEASIAFRYQVGPLALKPQEWLAALLNVHGH